MDTGSSVHGIRQTRILEWVAISFSRRSSQPRDWTRVSYIAGSFFTTEPPEKPLKDNMAYYGTPLQYSCLENPTGGGAWRAAVHGVAKSWTRLSDFTFMHWRRKWQPTTVFLPGESQDGGAWWAAIYGVAQNRTRLKRLCSSSSSSSSSRDILAKLTFTSLWFFS